MVRQQMDFQREMSSTAYQRATQDMIKAGLNPGLMYGSGAAASTPQGASAEMQDPLAGISKGIETAQALRLQNSNIQYQGAQTGVASAQAGNIKQDTSNKWAQQGILENQQKLQQQDMQLKSQDLKLKQQSYETTAKMLPSMLKKAQADGDYAQINQIMGVINSGASSAGSLMSIPNVLKGMLKGKEAPLKKYDPYDLNP